jgi:hypothetical protein
LSWLIPYKPLWWLPDEREAVSKVGGVIVKAAFLLLLADFSFSTKVPLRTVTI